MAAVSALAARSVKPTRRSAEGCGGAIASAAEKRSIGAVAAAEKRERMSDQPSRMVKAIAASTGPRRAARVIPNLRCRMTARTAQVAALKETVHVSQAPHAIVDEMPRASATGTEADA